MPAEAGSSAFVIEKVEGAQKGEPKTETEYWLSARGTEEMLA
jgi:hypothetical protein